MIEKIKNRIEARRANRAALRTYNAISRVSDPRQMEELFAASRH